MKFKYYKHINNISGWIVFTIAAITYLKTIEPTASFWDCSEYITSAYKLEICHPPGAPFFMLVANLISHLSPDSSKIALMINSLSAICSAFTILFLFWTITLFSKKLFLENKRNDEINLIQILAIIGAGLTGSLTYTFSDTFWFSAVEGEVYALSSFITALVFWSMLKWEESINDPYADKWLMLIAYLIGISIGVHLLNLLCIPALAMVYLFCKNSNPNFKKILITILISFVIVAAILFGLIRGLPEVGGWFELLFVNVFQFPYNSGLIFYFILVLCILSWAIWESMHPSKGLKKVKLSFILSISVSGIPFSENFLLGLFFITILSIGLFLSKTNNHIHFNNILIGLLLMIIGYSSYALIIIRSSSNPPMDENSPNNIFTLKSYLSREQYVKSPLFFGQTFVSEKQYKKQNGQLEEVSVDKGAIWSKIIKKRLSDKDKYFISGRKKQYVYEHELNAFFPRMYSQDTEHINEYIKWSDFKGKYIKINSFYNNKWVRKPTFQENLKYFFRYQINFMYWRYFLWNFSGRQNDIQSHGEISNGNWITGIKLIDQLRLGPQVDMSTNTIHNKGNNKFYMLPLLLGILGIVFQISSQKKGIAQLYTISILFFMTGLAIVIYLNQTPIQARERDYAYVGSFYAFCIWIGIGSLSIFKKLQNFKKNTGTIANILGVLFCLLVPTQMAFQTWNNHNRSGRYIVRDFAKNYLSTCEKNAILFTNGDNETFPLWYVQEVEGFRTDVRVCNLSYLQADWYIDQMKRQSYQSKPLPIDWSKKEYIQGKHDIVYVFDSLKGPILIQTALNHIKSDNQIDKKLPNFNIKVDYIPSNKILIPINSKLVISSGLVKHNNIDWIPSYLVIDLSEKFNKKGESIMQKKQLLLKREIMILDILKNNSDWKRPIYFSATSGFDQYLRLSPYFRCDGIAYRIMPFKASEYQPIDVDVMYNNVMNKYRWGNLEKRGLYLDETAMQVAKTFRIIFSQLAYQLAIKKDYKRTKLVLDKCLKVIPSYNIPYDCESTYYIADSYFKIGCKNKALQLYKKMIDISLKNLKWYNKFNTNQYITYLPLIQKELSILCFIFKMHPEIMEEYTMDYLILVQHYKQIIKEINNEY